MKLLLIAQIKLFKTKIITATKGKSEKVVICIFYQTRKQKLLDNRSDKR